MGQQGQLRIITIKCLGTEPPDTHPISTYSNTYREVATTVMREKPALFL
jgi:hypothetical protein